MNKPNPKSLLSLLLALSVVPASIPLPAEAGQQSGKSGGSLPTWTNAHPSMIGDLKSFLATPAGAALLTKIPAIGAVQGFDPKKESHLEALGAMTTYLRSDFEARLSGAVSPAAQAQWQQEIAAELAAAHEKAAPEVAFIAQLHAEQSAASYYNGELDAAGLRAKAADLDGLELYGTAVIDNPKVRGLKEMAEKAKGERTADSMRRIAEGLFADSHLLFESDEGRVFAMRIQPPEYKPGSHKTNHSSRPKSLGFDLDFEAPSKQPAEPSGFVDPLVRGRNAPLPVPDSGLAPLSPPAKGRTNAPAKDRLVIKFKESVILDFGGFGVEAGVGESEITAVLWRHGLAIIGMEKGGGYLVATDGRKSGAEIALAVASENTVRSATPVVAQAAQAAAPRFKLAFKKTVIVRLSGFAVEATVTESEMERAIKAHGFEIVDSDGKGAYTVRLASGRAAEASLAEIKKEVILKSADQA